MNKCSLAQFSQWYSFGDTDILGQYQSKGQCVAFQNKVQTIADIVPRTLSELFINISDIYGHKDIIIRVMKLRKALRFLETNHPAYDDIKISKETFCSIEKEENLWILQPKH